MYRNPSSLHREEMFTPLSPPEWVLMFFYFESRISCIIYHNSKLLGDTFKYQSCPDFPDETCCLDAVKNVFSFPLTLKQNWLLAFCYFISYWAVPFPTFGKWWEKAASLPVNHCAYFFFRNEGHRHPNKVWSQSQADCIRGIRIGNLSILKLTCYLSHYASRVCFKCSQQLIDKLSEKIYCHLFSRSLKV